jgi:hypothetical protein
MVHKLNASGSKGDIAPPIPLLRKRLLLTHREPQFPLHLVGLQLKKLAFELIRAIPEEKVM